MMIPATTDCAASSQQAAMGARASELDFEELQERVCLYREEADILHAQEDELKKTVPTNTHAHTCTYTQAHASAHTHTHARKHGRRCGAWPRSSRRVGRR